MKFMLLKQLGTIWKHAMEIIGNQNTSYEHHKGLSESHLIRSSIQRHTRLLAPALTRYNEVCKEYHRLGYDALDDQQDVTKPVVMSAKQVLDKLLDGSFWEFECPRFLANTVLVKCMDASQTLLRCQEEVDKVLREILRAYCSFQERVKAQLVVREDLMLRGKWSRMHEDRLRTDLRGWEGLFNYNHAFKRCTQCASSSHRLDKVKLNLQKLVDSNDRERTHSSI